MNFGKVELQDLVTEIVRELRSERTIIDFARDYDLTLIDLFFQGGGGDYANDFLFYARHDADQINRGEHADVPVDGAAEEAVILLEKLKNWREIAFENNLKTIYILVKRGVSATKKYLYAGSSGGSTDVPGDPWLPLW